MWTCEGSQSERQFCAKDRHFLACRRRENTIFSFFRKKIDVFGARSPESDRSFFAPDRAQPTNRPRSGNFLRILCLRRPFSSKKIPATYDSVWTKVGLLVELYTNPPSDLYNSIMLLHNSNSKFEALGPKSTGCTVYYPRGGVWY